MTLDEVNEHFKGLSALARALGLTKSATYQWTAIPYARQEEIEYITHGALKARIEDAPKIDQERHAFLAKQRRKQFYRYSFEE